MKQFTLTVLVVLAGVVAVQALPLTPPVEKQEITAVVVAVDVDANEITFKTSEESEPATLTVAPKLSDLLKNLMEGDRVILVCEEAENGKLLVVDIKPARSLSRTAIANSRPVHPSL